jgi:hypothetical protein
MIGLGGLVGKSGGDMFFCVLVLVVRFCLPISIEVVVE